MVSKTMLPALLRKQMAYVPEAQPFYTYINGSWHAATNTSRLQSSAQPLHSIRLITWNIDFMAPYPRARMAAAISYLGKLVSDIPATSAAVIFLQEMQEERDVELTRERRGATDLTQLCNASWVQEHFNMTDVNMDGETWGEATYGQVTLFDRRLHVKEGSRLPFVSEFGRNALLVDIPLAEAGSGILRLCNVHLDSMAGAMRPVQWKAAAKHLQDQEAHVAASILAGDCNATRPRDRTEPQDNGFKDAYLELGGVEGDENGSTWGFQSKSGKKFGNQRLDKVAFWGGVEVKSLERIGVGVSVEDDNIVRRMQEDGELSFVTDHYGLMGELRIEGGLQAAGIEDAIHNDNDELSVNHKTPTTTEQQDAKNLKQDSRLQCKS